MIEEKEGFARRWPLLVAVGAAVLVAALGPVTCSMLTSPRASPSNEAPPTGHAQLTKILASLREAWNPSERQRLLDAARSQADELTPAFRYVLGRAGTADFLPTCNLAVAIDLRAVRPVLAAGVSTMPPALAPAVLRAAHALESYEWLDLAPFLDGAPDLVVAALECAKTVAGRDNLRIAKLLASGDPAIREAAGAALEPAPGPEATALVVELTESGRPEVASAARRAFLGLDWEGVAGAVSQVFAQADGDVRCLALEKILREGKPWLAPHDLLRVARDEGPLAVRTLALQCLETLGGVDGKDLLAAQRQMPPLLRYHAARCALGDRKHEAVAVLLDLVEAKDATEATAEAARDGARILLASITGTQIHEEAATWREWFRQHPDFDASAARGASPPPR